MMDEAQTQQQPLVASESNAAMDAAADTVVRRHMGFAMGAGAIPVPVFDLAAVTAVQLAMLRALAAVYQVSFDSRSSRAFLTSLAAALTGRTLARVGASLAKSIPVVGPLGGGAAQVLLTGASTYAVGRLFKRVFREGRPLETLDMADARREANSYLEAGRERAQAMLDNLRKLRG